MHFLIYSVHVHKAYSTEYTFFSDSFQFTVFWIFYGGLAGYFITAQLSICEYISKATYSIPYSLILNILSVGLFGSTTSTAAAGSTGTAFGFTSTPAATKPSMIYSHKLTVKSNCNMRHLSYDD